MFWSHFICWSLGRSADIHTITVAFEFINDLTFFLNGPNQKAVTLNPQFI